jgi:hypothetical protein
MDQLLDAQGNVIIRPMFPVGKLAEDEGVYALPYQGAPTGDPVINQMRPGTYDRPASILDLARQYQLLNPGFPQLPVQFPGLLALPQSAPSSRDELIRRR